MFGFFRKSPSANSAAVTPPAAKTIASKPSPESDSDSGDDSNGQIDAVIEVGGGKGWPTNATVLLYHKVQGLICVGTDEGAIYVYGDGFQFMRPWLAEEPIEVVSIVALHPNKILVVFGDNSIVVMELPSLEVIDLLPPAWLPSKLGDITSIHADLPCEKNFVYIGTSEGSLQVLDVMESAIRVCDFTLHRNELGISGSFSISDIQSCPKDERYLAIALDGASVDSGYVIIFDFVKSKVHKSFKTKAIASLSWHHLGEVLFAGTRTAELLLINVEKGACNKVWNGNSEKIEDYEEDDQEDGGNSISIRRISWLAPQHASTTEDGCLFVLLASHGSDNDNLKNVVFGFTPMNNYTEMELIFALPPVHNEKIISFRVVPTYDKNTKDGAAVTPALLLLTQKQSVLNATPYERYLKILRCPTTSIGNWALEMGTLDEPRRAKEVQPNTTEVTCIKATVADINNPISLGKALLTPNHEEEERVTNTAVVLPKPTSMQSVLDDEDDTPALPINHRMSRRLSARQFFQTTELPTTEESWEMVLVNGEHEEKNGNRLNRRQDILFHGHEDGTIVIYGVSLPDERREFGRSSIWLPLLALRCGTTNVTTIDLDDVAGILCAGDEAGGFVLYESYDAHSSIGATEVLKRIYEKHSMQADERANEADIALNLQDFSDNHLQQDCAVFDYYNFTSVRDIYRFRFPCAVTAILPLGSFLQVIVGTEDANIYVLQDLRSLPSGSTGSTNAFTKVEKLEATGARGAVKHFELGYYAHKGILVTCIYAFFTSGHIVIFDLQTLHILSYNCAVIFEKEDIRHEICQLSTMYLVNAKQLLMKKPTLPAYLYHIAKVKALKTAAHEAAVAAATAAEEANNNNSNNNNSPPPPSTTGTQPKRRTMFFGFGGGNNSPPPPPSSSSSSGSTTTTSTTTATTSEEDYYKYKTFLFQEEDIPKRLQFVYAKYFITCQLDHFLAIHSPQLAHMSNVAQSIQSIHCKEITKNGLHIVTSQLLQIHNEEKAAAGHDEEITLDNHFRYSLDDKYIVCCDESGLLRFISCRQKKVIYHMFSLEGIISSELMHLTSGQVLVNGNTYLMQPGTMIYTSSIQTGEDYHISYPLPERAIPTSQAIDKNFSLKHGREQFLLQLKQAIKKRRSSVITLSAAPTDLYKIFQKTREQRQKEELFGNGATETSPMSTTRKVTQQTNSLITNDMQQLKEQFHERGERINRIAMKMDDFKQGAMEYRQAMQAQKELLKQRNARWGLF